MGPDLFKMKLFLTATSPESPLLMDPGLSKFQ